MSTHRLYYDDPYLVRFRARLVERGRDDVGPWVRLDRSAFYPTGGGQPHDLGTLDDAAVRDVVEEEGDILHRVDAYPSTDVVTGRIDWSRRFDHMQQHTTQHVLSRIFLEHYDARTVGFGIGPAETTLDVDRLDLSETHWTEIEDRFADLVRAALPVSTRIVSAAEAGSLNLRKLPPGLSSVRVVRIGELEQTACGGTHVTSTHELGLVKILSTERMRSRLRFRFLAGDRARRDYRHTRAMLRRMAVDMTTALDEVEPTVRRLRDTVTEQRRSLVAQSARLLVADISGALRSLDSPVRVIGREITPEEGMAAPAALTRLMDEPRSVILLGWPGEGKASLLFGRSADVDLDLRPILTGAAAELEGRGGGHPNRVQGGGPRLEGLSAALRVAERTVAAILTGHGPDPT